MAISVSSGDVTSTPRILEIADSPTTVTVKPDSGSTALVRFSTSKFSDIRRNQGIWQNWPAGPVTELTTDSLTSPVSAIEISRVSGTGNVRWELNQ